MSFDNRIGIGSFLQLRHADLAQRLAHECKKTSQKAVAAKLAISPQYLNDILHGRREISAQVAAAMGFERVVTFVKWGGKPNP